MILTSLRINQLSPAGLDWCASYFSEIDGRSLEHVLDFFREDAVAQVNDGMPLYGKAAVRGLLGRYFETFERVEHELLNVFGADSQFVAEVLCHYTPRATHQRVTMPGASIFERDESGHIVAMRIFISSMGMFEAFAAVGPKNA